MSTIDPDLLAEAAAWRLRLTEANAESSAEFAAWLAQGPEHAAMWKRVQSPWRLLGERAAAPEVVELRRRALASAHDAGRQHSRWRRRVRVSRLAVAACLAVVGFALLAVWSAARPDVYHTKVGERRVVRLEDGSRISLDSSSEVRVRYSDTARELTLASGQARFDVTHDVGRPFSVRAQDHEVIATGTSFNVDLNGPQLLVTLIEGHVIVAPTVRRATPGKPRIELEAGEQVAFANDSGGTVARVDVERATAWQNGELIFDNEPLSSVVTRVSRYSDHALVVEDAAAGELRISGVFHVGDVDSFVSTIASYLPVQSHRAPDGTLHLAHR